jgi:hypothetical protein
LSRLQGAEGLGSPTRSRLGALKIVSILLVVSVCLVVILVRSFGPVRPLERLVVDRLSRDGSPAGISEANPLNGSRYASTAVELEGQRLEVGVHPVTADEEPPDGTKTFDGFRAEMRRLPYGEVWEFSCPLNSLYFDYGRMEVSVVFAEDPSTAVPEVHRLLRCG